MGRETEIEEHLEWDYYIYPCAPLLPHFQFSGLPTYFVFDFETLAIWETRGISKQRVFYHSKTKERPHPFPPPLPPPWRFIVSTANRSKDWVASFSFFFTEGAWLLILERGHLSFTSRALGIQQGKEGKQRKTSMTPWGHLTLEQYFSPNSPINV